jgi:2-polyprenyl-3-methyl-5-hydroxy-6-metoxy-1,4-benzoquinol methylase
MGFDWRYARLVLELLSARKRQADRVGRFFEIGYGCGALLEAIHAAGAEVEGIEVSTIMRDQARARLPVECRERLHLGSFLDTSLTASDSRFDVIFWNDVLEHLVPDEALDFLRRAHSLLAPGGCLVTITPNWHMRPSDVTDDHRPPRTEAEGLHLKEYTLRETTELLQVAGFVRVGTPLFVTRQRMHLAGLGLASVKRLGEPLLEYLPFRFAKLLCRGLALSCTLAWKAE